MIILRQTFIQDINVPNDVALEHTLMIILRQTFIQDINVPNDGEDSLSNDGKSKRRSISGRKLVMSIP